MVLEVSEKRRCSLRRGARESRTCPALNEPQTDVALDDAFGNRVTS